MLSGRDGVGSLSKQKLQFRLRDIADKQSELLYGKMGARPTEARSKIVLQIPDGGDVLGCISGYTPLRVIPASGVGHSAAAGRN